MIRDENESLPREELKKLQGERLRALVQRLYANVPLYKQRLDEAGIDPGAVKGLDDLTRLPFTYKKDLRDSYPFNLFAVPLRDIVRIHASSGTTGKPTTVGYTAGDIEHVGRVHGPHVRGRGRDPGRHHPERLRLRPLHRRPGRPLRRRAPGGGGRAHLGRQHAEAAHAPPGLRFDGALLHPQLRALHLGRRPRDGRRHGRAAAARGDLRRRTVVRGHAPRHPGEAERPGHRHLRSLRDHGPGRLLRMRRGPTGPAHQRGSLPGRDHRSQDSARSWPTASWANW